MEIGVVLAPKMWRHWPKAKAFLEPARKFGGFATTLEPDEELIAVMDGDELLAVATVWLAADDDFVEVKLVGGRDHRRWLEKLDQFVGACAAGAGATALRAGGRRGWLKALSALGWDAIQLENGSMGYQRRLGVSRGQG